jgi:hypothetical protein
MELLNLPQCWQSSHQPEDEHPTSSSSSSIETPFGSPTEQNVSRVRRPVWDLSSSRRRPEEQEAENDDDYAWYYNHPERYIWRPRRRRPAKSSSRQKNDSPFTVFDFLLNISRDTWTISDAQHSTVSSSLLSSPTGSPSDVRFPNN